MGLSFLIYKMKIVINYITQRTVLNSLIWQSTWHIVGTWSLCHVVDNVILVQLHLHTGDLLGSWKGREGINHVFFSWEAPCLMGGKASNHLITFQCYYTCRTEAQCTVLWQSRGENVDISWEKQDRFEGEAYFWAEPG